MLALLFVLGLQDPPAEMIDRVREYLKSGDAAVAKTLEGGDLATVGRAVRLAMRPPPTREGGQTKTHEVASDVDPSVKITYHISIPEAASKGDPLPLLVTLHGGGRGADLAADWLDYRVKELKDQPVFILAPRAGRADWGPSLLGYSHVLSPLRDALARYPIDPDRVWLDGASMGASGAWQIGSLYPDRFAALAPRGGCPKFINVKGEGGAEEVRPFFARNMRALPVNWTIGAKDTGIPLEKVRAIRGIIAAWNYELEYKEMPEGGHEWFPDETPRIMEWLAKKTRVADPPEVRWSSWDPAFNRAYWVEALDATGKAVKLPVKDREGQLIEARTGLDTEMRITAIVRRTSNRIEVTAEGFKQLRLRFNDRLIDFSKPVIVSVNGKKAFDGKLAPSVQRMLDEVRRRGDPSFLYPAEVTVKVP